MVAAISPLARRGGGFRTLADALGEHPEASVVSIAVPGDYAAYVAERALEAGRHVFLYSGNVPREAEIALKRRALELGLLLMGPDCGTAIIGGVGFGFANRVPSGPVGIVGTSGSAIQDVCCGLTQHGVGITHAIGTGSGDLMAGVDGAMTELGLRLFAADPATRVIVAVAGRATWEMAGRLASLASSLDKPVVLRVADRPERGGDGNLLHAADLDDAVRMAVALARGERPDARPPPLDVSSRAAALLGRRDRVEGRLVGLFAGGARARSAQLVLRESGVDAVLAQHALTPGGSLDGPGNLLADLGGELYLDTYTHPLVDQTLRCQLLEQAAADPAVEIVLFDLALGDGVHPNPAPELVAALTRGRQRRGEAPLVTVASVSATEADPQDAGRQRSVLAEAGVQMTHSATAAARLCATLKSGARGGVT